jgi:hypothetical protein
MYGLQCRSPRLASRPAVIVDQPSPAAAPRLACLDIPLDMSGRPLGGGHGAGQRASIETDRGRAALVVWWLEDPLADGPRMPYITP